MSVCKGCGAVIQHTNPKLAGYSPKEGSDYCRRCFRLMHYDDLTIELDTAEEAHTVLNACADTEGMIVWTVDLFDFEADMINGIHRFLPDKTIIMVVTKRDLLPKDIKDEKIFRFVNRRLKEAAVSPDEIYLVSAIENDGIDELRQDLMTFHKPLIFVGRANAGKSTLLNALLKQNITARSRFPGTTLAMHTIEGNGLTCIDTPGMELEGSMLTAVNVKDLKTIVPSSAVKPAVYQMYEDQAYFLGGVCQVVVQGVDQATSVFYISSKVALHRTSAENAEEKWKKHYGTQWVPVPKENQWKTYTISRTGDKMDAVIDGLGWVSLSGTYRNIKITVPKGVRVTFREAMI